MDLWCNLCVIARACSLAHHIMSSPGGFPYCQIKPILRDCLGTLHVQSGLLLILTGSSFPAFRSASSSLSILFLTVDDKWTDTDVQHCSILTGSSSTANVTAGAGVGHSSTVWAVAFSPDGGSKMISCSDDSTLRIWECHFARGDRIAVWSLSL